MEDDNEKHENEEDFRMEIDAGNQHDIDIQYVVDIVRRIP